MHLVVSTSGSLLASGGGRLLPVATRRTDIWFLFGFSLSGKCEYIVGGARGWSRAPKREFSAPSRAPQRMRPCGDLVPPLTRLSFELAHAGSSY